MGFKMNKKQSLIKFLKIHIAVPLPVVAITRLARKVRRSSKSKTTNQTWSLRLKVVVRNRRKVSWEETKSGKFAATCHPKSAQNMWVRKERPHKIKSIISFPFFCTSIDINLTLFFCSGVVLKNKKSKKGPPHDPSGLLANWDQDVDMLPARSSASAASRLSSVPLDNDFATGAGGIPSDDDEIEGLDTATRSGFRFRVRDSFSFFFSKLRLVLLTSLLVSRNGQS
jgi:hypothetical protein